MWRFLPGVILLQVVTLVLLWVARDQPWQQSIVSAGIPAGLFALVTSLWFASIGRSLAERSLQRQQASHAREREQWHRKSAESEQTLLREAHKNLERQQRRVHRGANLKVGMAFTLAAAAGVLLLLTPLVTLGLLTLTTASGALGGYLLRGRRDRARTPSASPNDWPDAQPGGWPLSQSGDGPVNEQSAQKALPSVQSHRKPQEQTSA